MQLEHLPGPEADLPVAALAEHLRLASGFADEGAADPLLAACLRAAGAAVEARIGKALTTRRFRWIVTRWPVSGIATLPVAPVQAVEAIALSGPEGTVTQADPENWSVLRDARSPRLVGRFGRALPRIPRDGQAAVTIRAGFADDWTGVPADLRHAVLLLAAQYFENRAEGHAGTMPFAVMALIAPHRPVRIGAA